MSPAFYLHSAAFFSVPLHNWPALWGGVVYMLGRRTPDGFTDILYVGQTGELRDYIGYRHHKWEAASVAGMNVLLIHWQHAQTKRLDLETVLRRQYRPPLNEQLTPHAAPFNGPGLPAYNAMTGEPAANAMASGLAPYR